MVKLIAYYKEPADTAEFDKKYFEEHMPLARKMPGLIKAEVSRHKGFAGGQSPYYMQADMYFQSMDDLNKAMMSDEGKATAKNIMSFAKDIIVMTTAEIVE